MPFFSVIIPVFNRAHLIEGTLESVFAQTFADYEVVVVDDGSTDDTVEVLRRFGARVRVLTQPNQGPGAARNLGIRHATGEYVVFLDSDDLWFPWTLETYREAIRAHHGPTVVMGSADYGTGPGERHPLVTEVYGDYLATAGNRFVRAACVIAVKRDAITRVGGFTTERINAEDYDLLYRLGTAPGFVRIVSPEVVRYRLHPDSVSADLEKTFRGAIHQLEQERTGKYPGGAARAYDRRQLILFSARDVSWALLRKGHTAWALDVYRSALALHLSQPRWRYLLGFPAFALGRALTRRRDPR